MKMVIFILLSILTVKISMADNSVLPNYEQAEKLAAAAWKISPQNIDVTYYISVIDNTRTEENIRKIYKEAFNEMYGPDEELDSGMLERKKKDIELNVNDRLVEQRQGGVKVKYRIRGDGKSYRVDRVYGWSAKTILKGTIQEEFRTEKKFDANTSFEETFIETPSATGGFELYTYYHKLKNATIEKIESSRAAIEDRKISRVLHMPNASILQIKLGSRKNNLATEPYDINESKIEQLCSGTLEGFSVKIRPDEKEPDAKDRIEISLFNKETEILSSVMTCAKEDYSKVHNFEVLNPADNNSIIYTRTYSNFDSQGFPHDIIEVQYDSQGNVQLQETYQIEDIRINTSIPKEVFEFNPPKDYEVTNYRLPEAQRQISRIENLKKRLKDKESSGRRLEALLLLKEHLKDNPDGLKEIAISMLQDERDDIRALAFSILRTLLKDNPQELRDIATYMQDDEDPKIQKFAANILQQLESSEAAIK